MHNRTTESLDDGPAALDRFPKLLGRIAGARGTGRHVLPGRLCRASTSCGNERAVATPV
jgi:hypothetical protein